MTDGNGWDEYRKLVILELKRNGNRLEKVERRLNSIDRHITDMKAKMYMASTISAIIFSGMITLVLKFV